ncbi:MAG: DNA methyltransferase [Verrucomicrobiae bacterium]|nr:DNA methyltransferase [Verrucomicrobiae bacterium]
MKKTELSNVKIGTIRPPAFEHINRQIPPEPHTAMYVWHKYWSRKTWNVVAEHIKAYTREHEIVFDPFAGSGVVAIEAARNKRRAIVCDLNPAASRITELTLRPVNTLKLLQAFERVRDRVKKPIEELYTIHCLKCSAPLVADCFVREGDEVAEVRYKGCPQCGHRCATGCKPRRKDLDALDELERKRIALWYPRNQLYYADGEPFKEKQRFESLDALFTRRNLRAAAMLREAIESEASPQLRKFLLGAFTSMIHLCTRMCPALEPGEGNHQTAFSSTWNQHSYWSAKRYLEANVWDKFESAAIGHQGLLKAKNESNELLGDVKLTNDWRKVLDGEADIAVVTDDCIELMKRLPDECVDYIFTDPPYDASVQYGELSFLWNAWLKEDFRYTERIAAHEIVRNERQKKPFEVYYALLNNSFQGFYRVLRPERYLTLTFHNPTFKVRNATVRVGVEAGFDYEHLHHQPLGQVSAKAMLQPFGSAQGDFYLRFAKSARPARQMEEISEERFRRIVIETCRKVIAERAEPTPYTILINQVDPVLAKRGLFGTLQTGLDVKTVLEQSLGSEFELVDAKLGGAAGKLWWFADKTFAERLEAVPLTERVEATVFRCLHEKGRVSFTEVWDTVAREFPNSLTSDSTSIREALELYGHKVTGGAWMLRDEIRLRLTSHSELIALLAQIGRARGHDIWIGQREQRELAGGLAESQRLRDLVTAKPAALDGVTNLRPELEMDLLWLRGNEVVRAFEVECTTTMTSGLQRGSNLPAGVPKTMVIPEERERDFVRKMKSPLFSHHFAQENWSLLFFDVFRQAFAQAKSKTAIEPLLGKKKPSSTYAPQAVRENQGFLSFSSEDTQPAVVDMVAERPVSNEG